MSIPEQSDPSPANASVAAIILTKNEERDLPACLLSLSGAIDEIHVVDSGSTDRTVEVATKFGASIYRNHFKNYSQQFNWALDNIKTSASWILRIDADERLTPELAAAIGSALTRNDKLVTGFEMARRTEFLGRTIRWGDTYPVWLMRLWRRGCGRCEDTWMDEHIILSTVGVERLHGDLVHSIPKSLIEWTTKHTWYASRECQDILGSVPSAIMAADFNSQASSKRWFKQRIYLRSPRFLRAALYWAYRYFFRLGFLDGKVGFIYHFLHAFWYRFLVDAILLEIERGERRHV